MRMRAGHAAGSDSVGLKRGIGCPLSHLHASGFKPLYAFSPILIFVLTLTMLSCGPKSGHFRIEGRFRNLNRAEFYVYSPDGKTDGLDTIKVADGRFAYEVPLDGEATFIIIFPNLSEQAVFGKPGASAKISGDASHLKDMEIKGTDTNEKMTAFRQNANRLSPPEIVGAVREFVSENPESPASLYLINKYLIQSRDAAPGVAYELLGLMTGKNPQNEKAARLRKQLLGLKASAAGQRLPDFSAKDTEGRDVRRAALKGRVNVINVWASWNNDSQNIQRRLRALKKKYGDSLGLLSICVDARRQDCERLNRRDSIDWSTVCDGQMWSTPLLTKFGLATVPGNIITDGRWTVLSRDLDERRLEQKIESVLK